MNLKYETEKEIDDKDYYSPFLEQKEGEQTKIPQALERAWKNRDFEIDKYWSRATYFWTFIAASFTAFFLISNKTYSASNELSFLVASLGLIFSASWYFVNRGSKKWQENWEKHIDLLEDFVTGPIYKTVLNQKGYSVSKINLIISEFVSVIWFGLWLKSMFPWQVEFESWNFNFWKFFVAIVTIFFLLKMTTKHDGERKNPKPFTFRRRRLVNVSWLQLLMLRRDKDVQVSDTTEAK